MAAISSANLEQHAGKAGPTPSRQSGSSDAEIQAKDVRLAEEEERAPAAVSDASGRKKRRRRLLLFALLPLSVACGAFFYVTGGRVMSTDNAYVQADAVGVSTTVPGLVVAVAVKNNDVVKAGDVLCKLRPDTYQIALDGAKAQLGMVRDQIQTLKANYRLAQAQILQAEADLPFLQTTFKRQTDMIASGATTRVAFDQAQRDLQSALHRITVAKAQASTVLAQLGGDPDLPTEKNPGYLQALATVNRAQRDLDDTVIRAPFDGVVTNVDTLQVGSYLQASQQAFSLVSTTRMWVAASPKETEMTWVRVGQHATVSIDTYPEAEWSGVVESISPASASSFSVLPAQNTTGNWVKVVQRIPIRVRLTNAGEGPPLRVGMSAVVDIDTGRSRGVPQVLKQLF